MKTICVEDLQPGMTLARTIVNKDMMVVLSEGTILTKAHITRLKFLDLPSLYIKDEYELSTNFQNVAAIFSPCNAFISEYKEIVNPAKEIFDIAAKGNGNGVPIEKTERMITRSLSPMVMQSGVIDYLSELNHLADDVYNHSLRISILAGVVGKWLGFPRAKINDLILAGFLHDIGKTKFEPRLVGKAVEYLKGDDLDTYMQHTLDGHQILRQNENLSEGVKLAALQHHEAIDGSGFPFNSSDKDIHEFAKIIAVVDLYDNITTEREGFRRETPFSAINKISQDMYTKLDPKICVPFLNHIKDAFLGSKVKLNNGLSGTVVRYEHDFAANPLIRIDQNTIIDLNTQKDIQIIEYNPK